MIQYADRLRTRGAGRGGWTKIAGGSGAGILLLSAAVLSSPAPSRGQEVRTLGLPDARSSDGFTYVYAAAELPDGRVLVTDSRERRLVLVDFVGGTTQQIGRRGQGPGEYRSVFSILPWPDGSYRVYDANQRRLVVVSAQGEVVGSEPFVAPPLRGFSAPRGPDARGFLYVDSRRLGPDGLVREAPVWRWNPATGESDSVEVVMQFAPGQGGRGIVPMPRGDAWSFLPDGSVARIVGEDDHVVWSGGRRGGVVGPLIPHPRIRVGRRERDAWVDALYAESAGSQASLSGGDDSGREEVRRARRQRFDADRFPDFMPVFEVGYVPASPRGEVWVKLSVLSDSAHTVFDVVDREGRLARRLRVDGRARVVGFGDGCVYLARKDEVDLEWLERYPDPAD